MVKEAYVFFNMVKDKTGKSVLLFVSTEHIAVLTPEDNVHFGSAA